MTPTASPANIGTLGEQAYTWPAMPSARTTALWIVEPNEELLDLIAELAPVDVETMGDAELRERLDRGARPGALVIDGTTYLGLAGEHDRLMSTPTLILTALDESQLPDDVAARRGAQIVRKPFELGELERGFDWLLASRVAGGRS